MPHSPLQVRFCAAAGPRLGFGHLVRCAALAEALGVPKRVWLRGSARTRQAARQLGWDVEARRSPDARRSPFRRSRPSVVVIDDPSARYSRALVRRVTAIGAVAVTISDLGRRRSAGVALDIDGGFVRRSSTRTDELLGPRFVLINSAVAQLVRRAAAAPARRTAIVIALGGGAYIRQQGICIARALAERLPHMTIQLAAGFVQGAGTPRLPDRCTWIAPAALPAALSTAQAAVVAGGLTLYEACALGTPAVGVAVVAAQTATIRAAAAAGACLDGTSGSRRRRAPSPAHIAACVAAICEQPACARRLSATARALVDGRGSERVARHIAVLCGAKETDRAA